MENNWSVYIHKNKANGKLYVGITGQNPPSKRWANGTGYRTNKYFTNAINKYGWEGFSHEVIFTNLFKREAELKEIELIELYNSTNRDCGYNINKGGGILDNILYGELHPSSHQVIYDGNTYINIKDFASKNNIPYSTAVGWLSCRDRIPKDMLDRGISYRGRDFNEQVGLAKGQFNGNSLEVECDGKTYSCIREFAELNDLSYVMVKHWFDRGRCPKEWYHKGLRKNGGQPLDEAIAHNTSKKVECDGIEFNSIAECAEYYNLNRETIAGALKRLENGIDSKWREKGLKYI